MCAFERVIVAAKINFIVKIWLLHLLQSVYNLYSYQVLPISSQNVIEEWK